MYLNIFNSENSGVDFKTEIRLIRLALFLSDKIILAGRSGWYLYLECVLNRLPEEKRFSYIKEIMPVITKGKVEEVQKYTGFYELYLKMAAAKNKNHRQLAQFWNTKKTLNGIKDDIIKWIRKKNAAKKIDNLSRFTFDSEDVIIIYDCLSENSKSNIEVVSNEITRVDSIFFMDKELLNNVPQTPFNLEGKEFLKQNQSGFLYGELASLPLVEDCSFEILKVIRENLLSTTDLFRRYLIGLKGLLLYEDTLRNNFAEVIKSYYTIKNSTAELFRQINENALLKNLDSAAGKLKTVKIYLCISSYKNLVEYLKQLNIIDERESLYIIQNIAREVNPEKGIPFLIAG